MSQVNDDDWWKRWIDAAGLDEITDPHVRWNCARQQLKKWRKTIVTLGDLMSNFITDTMNQKDSHAVSLNSKKHSHESI